MFPDTYAANTDGHLVDVREATDEDVAAGLVGAAGDFLVVRRGHGMPQWFLRADFLAQYTRVESTPAIDVNDTVNDEPISLAGQDTE